MKFMLEHNLGRIYIIENDDRLVELKRITSYEK